MKSIKISVWISAFVILSSSSLLAQTVSPNTPPGWKTYLDKVHGFSFAYPAIYKRICWQNTNDQDANKAAAEGRWVGLRHQRGDASIDFYLENDRFDLDGLTKHAPTGYDSPPPAVQEGDNTFYCYGPGGGGVQYADQFFFNLKGKTLYIVFDGPYVDKTPTDETKEIEAKMLATFRIL